MQSIAVMLRKQGDKALSPKLKEAIKVVACDGVWCGADLLRVGYDTSGLCPHCGLQDTWAHRVLECPIAQDLRDELLDADTKKLLEVNKAHLRGAQPGTIVLH